MLPDEVPLALPELPGNVDRTLPLNVPHDLRAACRYGLPSDFGYPGGVSIWIVTGPMKRCGT
jgi:hypothetical protein